MKTESVLEKVLASGALAVTSECGPPRGAVPQKVTSKGELLRSVVDAVNVTDNQTAMVRMSSFAACVIIKQMGLDPILQMVTEKYLLRLAAEWQGRRDAIELIKNPPTDQPLCIYLPLTYPHPPYGVEEPWYSLIDRDALP